MKGLDKMEEKLLILHQPADKVRQETTALDEVKKKYIYIFCLLFTSSGGVRHGRYGVPVSGRGQGCCGGGCDGWCRADPGSSQRRYRHRHGHQNGTDGQQWDGPGPQPIWELGWPEPAAHWEGVRSVATQNVENVIIHKSRGKGIHQYVYCWEGDRCVLTKRLNEAGQRN